MFFAQTSMNSWEGCILHTWRESQPARLEATFGARIISWAGLIHHLFSPGDKIIDELCERLGHQILFILQERKIVPSYYEGIPFSRVSNKTVEKSQLLANSTILPGMLGLFESLSPDRFMCWGDGNVAWKSSHSSAAAIVSVASCLPRGNVNVLSDELPRCALQAIEHTRGFRSCDTFSVSHFLMKFSAKDLSRWKRGLTGENTLHKVQWREGPVAGNIQPSTRRRCHHG